VLPFRQLLPEYRRSFVHSLGSRSHQYTRNSTLFLRNLTCNHQIPVPCPRRADANPLVPAHGQYGPLAIQMPPEDCRGSMAATLVSKPARIMTVDSRQTRPFDQAGSEKIGDQDSITSLCLMKIVALALSFLRPPAYLCRTADCFYRCIDEAFCFPNMLFRIYIAGILGRIPS
jgi:hypothetical protein